MATKYRLTDDVSLDLKVRQAKGVFLQHLAPSAEYTAAQMIDVLSENGVELSQTDLAAVRDVLVAEGVIQEV